MQVFRCLVEGCQHKFRSAAERKQHLVDAHAFPRDYHFERMHITQKHQQQRPKHTLQTPTKPQAKEGHAAFGVSEARHQALTGAFLGVCHALPLIFGDYIAALRPRSALV